jgi:large subunit ribosomal protein L6
MIWGTIRSLIYNLVKGVHLGFVKSLEINGVGYRSHIKSNHLILNLGYSHEILYPIPSGIKIICKKPTLIDISGIDSQLVGQVASKIRFFRKPEPYKG